jgi:hypothetical protein
MSKLILNGLFLLLTLNVCSRSRGPGNDQSSDASTPAVRNVSTDAETVLRRMSDFYRQAATLQVRSEQVMQVTAPTRCRSSVHTTSTIAAARPNRLSIHSQEGTAVVDLVCDGQTLTTCLPAIDHFTEAEAPDTFESLLQDPLAMRSAQFVLHLLADKPYETLMEGVTGTTYVGRERLEGTDVHHLRMIQDGVTWDAWVQAQGDPLLRQVSVELSGAMQQSSGRAGSAGEMRMTATETFRDWRVDVPLEDESFTFIPPVDAARVASL